MEGVYYYLLVFELTSASDPGKGSCPAISGEPNVLF
jgi:hypothetical protein